MGGRAQVSYSGAVISDANSWSKLTVLIDGVAISGAKALVSAYGPTNDFPVNLSFSRLTSVLSVGTHTFCLSLAATSGTSEIRDDATFTNQFWVQEIK